MRFILFVEGYTERKAIGEFLKRWLDPRLQSPIRIFTVRFSGYGELLRDVAKRANAMINDPRSGNEVIAVVSLLDFFGPTFPYPRGIDGTTERCRWAKKYIESLVNHEKFRHFFAVHEFEAWLLSTPGLFPREVQRHLPRQAPETVNINTPPKTLLRELYRLHVGRSFKETVNGPDLFSKLDPSDAYAKCPNFKALLDDMLELAHAAGY